MVEFYWSCVPGNFVDKCSGEPQRFYTFNGTFREWSETLIEVTLDMLNNVERETGITKSEMNSECRADIHGLYSNSVLFGSTTLGYHAVTDPVSNPLCPAGQVLITRGGQAGSHDQSPLGVIHILDLPK